MSQAAPDSRRAADAPALQAENAALRAQLAELEARLAKAESAAGSLNSSEERYSELLRISPYGVLVQENGTIRYINERGLQILGAESPQQVLGRSPREFVAPEFAALVEEREAELDTTGEAKPRRMRLLRLDGLELDVEIASVRFQGEDGYAVQTVFQDIGERLRLEAAAEEFAQRYRIIDELGSDYIYLDEIGPDGVMRPLWVTRAFERMTGYPLAATQDPEFLAQLVHPDDMALFMEHYHSLVAGQPGELIARLVRRDGSPRWVRHQCRPVKDPDTGEVKLLYGSVRDITEVREAHAQVERSERALREAQRIAHFGHWEVDLTRQHITWSEECCRLFGQDPATFVPTTQAFYEMVHPDDRDKVFAAGELSKETGELYQVEHRIILPDGSVRHVRQRAEMQPGPHGKPVCLIGTVLDITERVESEQKLAAEVAERTRVVAEARDYGDRYRTISELSEDFHLLARIAPDGQIVFLWITDAFERLTGYTAEDTKRSDFLATALPDDGEHSLLRQIEALRANVASSMEGPLVTKWGATIWLRSTARPFPDPANGGALVFASVRDITRRRMAEEALRGSEQQLRAAQRVGKIGSWEFDLHEASLVWSAEMYNIFGVDPELFTPGPESFLQLVHGDDRQRVVHAQERALTEGKPYAVEFRAVLPGGVQKLIYNRAELVADHAGQLIKILGTSQDVTEQWQKEQALQAAYVALEESHYQLQSETAERLAAVETLRQSEERYRNLLDSMEEGVILADFAERHLYANPAAERIYGVGPGELMNRTIADFIDEQTLERFEQETALRQTGAHSVYEFEITRPDGERRRLRNSVSPVRNAAGEVVASMGVFTDITEQEALRNRLLVEQREESIIMLAGGIAHDFNNMLMGVLGASALIEAGLPEGDTSNRELAQVIHTSANRMADLTNKLLAYARGGKYQTRRFDVNQAVQNASLMVRGNLPSRVSIELELAPEPLLVEADMGQIEQVLLNLLVNAIEAVDSSGHGTGLIRISTSHEHSAKLPPPAAGLLRTSQCVRISVVDTGGGMAPETLEKVFEPFFSTKFQGRGLGLAACSGIIRNHEGSIWAQSTLGQGSVFHVALPAVWTTEQAAEDAAEQQASPGRMLLVIDDDADARQITRRMLESRGYTVLTADSGRSGLELWRRERQRIDLVLLDMQMPDLSGEEVLRQLREEDSQARVLVCSGFAAEQAVEQLSDLNPAGFLAKPFGPRDLTQAVEDALNWQPVG